jgi:hypothetical protein
MTKKLIFRIVLCSFVSCFSLGTALYPVQAAENEKQIPVEEKYGFNPVLNDARIVTSSVVATNGDRIDVRYDFLKFRGDNNANQIHLQPLIGFGRDKEAFAQLDLPVQFHSVQDTVYGGLGGLATRLAWVYYRKGNLTQRISFKAIWPSNVNKHVSSRETILTPEWGTTYAVNKWFTLTGLVSYDVSVHQAENSKKINQLVFKTTPTFLLPKQSYFFIEPTLPWDFHDGRFEPLLRPALGKVFGKKKNLDINVFYETPLTHYASKDIEFLRTGVEVIWYF